MNLISLGNPVAVLFCAKCSPLLLDEWKGWPLRDSIPLLPRSIDGRCEACGDSAILEPNNIAWLNCHGPGNTGLPDYWALIISTRSNKWGHPYYLEEPCAKCGSRSTISLMNYPDGSRELKADCKKCGIGPWKILVKK